VTAGLVTFSTHVLDATTGRPAAGIRIRLDRSLAGGGWALTAEGQADADGRLRLPNDLDPSGLEPGGLEPGVYRVTFGTGAYFAARGSASFYPEVAVTFSAMAPGEHCHVPLLLSPFAYSTYRGS
jgi:5-hydroxyisourate hydrolase